MLFHAIKVHENFVFAAVKGDYGESIYPFFQYAVLIQLLSCPILRIDGTKPVEENVDFIINQI